MTRTTKAQEKQSKVRRQSQWRHQTLHIQLNCLLWEQLIMSTAIWLCAGKLLAGNELPLTGTTLNAPSVFLRFHTSSKSNVKGMYYYICYLGTDSLIQAWKLKAEKCRFVPSRENWQWATMQRIANKLTTTLKKCAWNMILHCKMPRRLECSFPCGFISYAIIFYVLMAMREKMQTCTLELSVMSGRLWVKHTPEGCEISAV